MGVSNSPNKNPKGKILRVKLGYNPNSSSIGSMIFAMPVAMLSAAVAFGTVSGLIFSVFSKKKNAADTEGEDTSDATNEMENSGHTE
ncbi:MAG TPA: hypothetical protein ENH94_06690 [Phycisphaerales bacterium]|nr:hypothetical protein [Phycisphaerales bacterium]